MSTGDWPLFPGFVPNPTLRTIQEPEPIKPGDWVRMNNAGEIVPCKEEDAIGSVFIRMLGGATIGKAGHVEPEMIIQEHAKILEPAFSGYLHAEPLKPCRCRTERLDKAIAAVIKFAISEENELTPEDEAMFNELVEAALE